MPDDLAPERSFHEGYEHLACRRFHKACEAFCNVLCVCPDALDDVAAAFGRPADCEQGLAALQEHARSHVASTALWALAGRLARNSGQLNEARRCLERAVEIEPDCATWWFELSVVHLAAGDPVGAATAHRRGMKLVPDRIARIRPSARRRRVWLWLARPLAQSRLLQRLIRRVVWYDGIVEIVEEGRSSAVARQVRWVHALEHGASLALFPGLPHGIEPEDLTEHLKHCRCGFWRWFLDRGVEHEIRRVLDVGCGEGHLAEHFVRHGYNVAGVTCNPYEQELCRRRGIRVIENDFHFLSAVDASFDLVFSSQSLEHSISTLFALWEWKRVVRPGGFLMISLPVPIDQDVRAAFPENYDSVADTVDIPEAEDGATTADRMRTACYAYGNRCHPFIPTYWQLRWLFHLVGLKLLAECVEDPLTFEILGIEYMDGRIPRDAKCPLNAMFFLRRPERSTMSS